VDFSCFKDVKRHIRNSYFVKTIKDKENLISLFKFLQDKLNGNLFPLTQKEMEQVGDKHLELLHYLFKGGKINTSKFGINYSIQDSLFDIYDFRIIPIELISSIYENFIGEATRELNKAYYTPSFLVDYILSQTVTQHLSNTSKFSCSVLDPSCGSGIFLIETLRKLIEKYKLYHSNRITDSVLWQLIEENIFGIDIDPNAIDIAIFSLYVTILDYKEPKEISSNFKFKDLRNLNFFPNADFFDESHMFNTVLSNQKFDFILGNPPWGHVDNSCYIDYINKKKLVLSKNQIQLDIGAKEISQAFLIRATDFLSNENQGKCTFIISSKAFYNTNRLSQNWRTYLLNNLVIDQIIELSPVNNKIAGGNHVFEGARQPAAIISFKIAKNQNEIHTNSIRHISIKPYLNYKFFKTFIISSFDIKEITQD
ncbi:MAG: N-6 DNA methylase, partial [Ignavibacteriae bacterium]|nr:N-6 DNA methylase [Ignavibacteriota bacterium]